MNPAPVDYLGGYPEELRDKALRARREGTLERRLLERYPLGHEITTNAALYDFAQGIKREHLRSSPPLAKVRYHDKLSTLHKAFGLHTYAVRVQGANLKSQNEIRIASLFKELPLAFLRMVVVHELAHLRHKEHDKAFYRLCQHMEPDYLRHELDLRLLLFARQPDQA
ncbi:MAG: M48 family metallopeptidase [Sandaracinaceae bacterium]|nr:M48 family metallopeptidase [Myxococcales bacterium]MCB9658143.1 M48 family metallopeptidase [Sandaracinaceae bacterium]